MDNHQHWQTPKNGVIVMDLLRQTMIYRMIIIEIKIKGYIFFDVTNCRSFLRKGSYDLGGVRDKDD